MISGLISLLSSLAALAKYIAARAGRHEAEGVGRVKAYSEAMQDAVIILNDITDVERSTLDRLRADRDGVLNASPDNRDNRDTWSERDGQGKNG